MITVSTYKLLPPTKIGNLPLFKISLITSKHLVWNFLISHSSVRLITWFKWNVADFNSSIVGALAEAYYKVPEELKLNVINYLNEDIINLLKGDVKDGGISKKITRVK